MDVILFYFILLFFSFFLSYFISKKLTFHFIKIISKTNFLGKDMHKQNNNFVCELGGVPVFLSFILSLMFVFFLNYFLIYFFNLNFLGIDLIQFILILLSLLLICFMGFIDDILGWKKGISQIQHFLLPIIFSIPIIVFALIYNISYLFVPFIGYLNFSVLYAFLLVPIAITATTNSFNLFAGFNGLEVGMGIIIFLTIAIFALLLGNFTLLIILFAWIGVLLGFLKYNKYPSKIFPGDIITLVNGCFVGISAIVLQLEILFAFLILIFIIEFFIKLKHGFKTECFGKIQKNNVILPNKKGGSLTHFILKKHSFTEKSFVYTMYLIQGLISIISLFLYFLIY